MIEIDFTEEELNKLKEQLKLFYQRLHEGSDDKITSLYQGFEDVLGKVNSKARGFEFMGEGIESDIAIALESKKAGKKHTFLTKARNKMKNDIRDMFHGIFEEEIV